MGSIGVNYDVSFPSIDLFFAGIPLLSGPAPVRRFLPELIRLIWDRKVEPGKVFDLTLSLQRAPRATVPWTSGRAIKVLLHPWMKADFGQA